jgi:hypothetical protein
MVADIHDMTYDQQSDADINSPHPPRIFRIQKTEEPVPKSSISISFQSSKPFTMMIRLLLLIAVILHASSHFAAGQPTHGHRHSDPDPRRRHPQHKNFHIQTNSNESTVFIVPVTDNVENTERRDGFEIHYREGNKEDTEKPGDSKEDEKHETSQEPYAEETSKGEVDDRTSSWTRYLMASLAVGLLVAAEIAG